MAVASRNLERAENFASRHKIQKAYGSYEALFEDDDVDVVYIATPHNFHFDNASGALNSGKAVLCEKPLCVNVKETRELIEIAGTTNGFLMEAMWTYFLPAVQKAREWVSSGAIGGLKRIVAEFGFYTAFDPRSRIYDPNLGGGSLLDIGIYPIAIAWLFTGKDPVEIHVAGKTAQTGVDDDVTMIFDYGDMVANLTCSFRCDLYNHAMIIGDKGMIVLPRFWVARECKLFRGSQLIEHFRDNRKSIGLNFEAEAVCRHFQRGDRESEIMPLANSLKFQEYIAGVMDLV